MELGPYLRQHAINGASAQGLTAPPASVADEERALIGRRNPFVAHAPILSQPLL
jgi:hypothetical protein